MSNEITTTLSALVHNVETMRDRVTALADSGDYEELIRGLVPLQALLRELRDLDTYAKEKTAEVLPERVVTVEGVGTVQRRAGSMRRKWDSEELLRRLVFQTLADPDTGELRARDALGAVDEVYRLVLDVMPVTPSMGWRTTALKARGFDPDEWCEATQGKPTVQVTTSQGRKA